MAEHATASDLVVTGLSPEDVTILYGSSQFKFEELIVEFAKICSDFTRKQSWAESSKSLHFAAEIIFRLGEVRPTPKCFWSSRTLTVSQYPYQLAHIPSKYIDVQSSNAEYGIEHMSRISLSPLIWPDPPNMSALLILTPALDSDTASKARPRGCWQQVWCMWASYTYPWPMRPQIVTQPPDILE